MERPEDFEERQESATETFGETEPAAGGDAAQVDEDRSRDGRFGGTDRPESTSDTEERRTDG
jgi:hypothetical protein